MTFPAKLISGLVIFLWLVQLGKVRFVFAAALPLPTRRMSNARVEHLSAEHTLDAKWALKTLTECAGCAVRRNKVQRTSVLSFSWSWQDNRHDGWRVKCYKSALEPLNKHDQRTHTHTHTHIFSPENAHTWSWLLQNVFRIQRIFLGFSPHFSRPPEEREMNYGNENKEKYAEGSEKQLPV